MRDDTYDATRSQTIATVVTGWKVRALGHELEFTPAGGDFSGLLLGQPTVGQNLIIARFAEGDVLRTSPVRNVSIDPDGAVRVETMNSTYRLVLSTTRLAADEAA